MVAAFTVQAIRRKLLHWYGRNGRDLPWRRTRDPYAIWIAETMLQQTQVRTVLPYYQRFLKVLPTVRSLDRARRDKVLALWSGLGYYRRGANLKEASRKIVRDHGGRLPRDFHALCSLPGVGSYTAGALMSIAFNARYPALDGNARRVISRLLGLTRETDIREAGKRLVPRAQPGQFNQTLMDLGAGVCLPRKPICAACPLASCCTALSRGHFASASTRKQKIKKTEWPLALIRNNGRVLLRRGTERGILEGIWQLPGGERSPSESTRAALLRHLDGVHPQPGSARQIVVIRHAITYRRIKAPVFVFSDSRNMRLPDSNWRWISTSSLARHPVSSLSLKAIQCFRELPRGRHLA